MAYIGAPLVSTNFVLDQHTATAGQTAFTMTRTPASAQAVLVAIDGVIQEPGIAYTISGTTLTMTSGVPLDSKVWIVHLGVRGTTTTPADGSVEEASFGTDVMAGAWKHLQTQTASSSATLDFTAFNSSLYDDYELIVDNLVPASDNVTLVLRTSTDGGSTYDAGVSDYSWGSLYTGTTAAGGNDEADSGISLANANTFGTGTSEGASSRIQIINPAAAAFTRVLFHTGGRRAADNVTFTSAGFGMRLSAADVNAVRLLFSSGNIASGTARLYGRRKAS
jgi:hypothetical protein